MKDPHAVPVADSAGGEDVLLLKTWNDGEAAMIRQLLATYDIPCRVVSDIPHTVFPIMVDGLGEVRILVATRHEREARSLLAEHLRQGLELLQGDKPEPDGGGAER